MKTFLSVLLLSFAFTSSHAHATVQQDFTDTLNQVKEKFQSNYGIAPLKEKFFKWTPESAAKKFQQKASADPQLTEDRARRLIQEYFYSARDYHAKAIYSPGSYTAIPLAMRVSGTKVFVVGVSDACACDIEPGDEVSKVDGKNAFIEVLKKSRYPYVSHPGTDLRDAVNSLTTPYGMLMDEMPKAPTVTLSLLKKSGVKKDVTLAWGKISALKSNETPQHEKISKNLTGWSMTDTATVGVGSYGSIFVKPANVLWENAPTSIFPSWIAELPNSGGKKIGKIRISDFAPGDAAAYTAAVKEFETLVDQMNSQADVLVLDTLANSGGMIDYMYALSSYFYDHEVPTFQFSYRLFDALVNDAVKTVPELEALKTDDDAKKYFGEDYFGFPVDLDFAQEVLAFYRGIRDDAAAGLKFSKIRAYNASKVKPNPRVRFLKPVYLLSDERTASCGDFFAAYMQDTKRAKVVGAWSMGAGGFTGGSVAVVNPLKINRLIIPIATGFRLDGKTPVENLGVLPDFWIQPTESDFKTSFSQYRGKIFQFIASDLTKSQP